MKLEALNVTWMQSFLGTISGSMGETSTLACLIGAIVLIAAGAASLVYWDWTESQGRGDLRFYGLVQFYPMFALPAIMVLFRRHRYTVGRYLLWVVLWYALSKIFEHLDHEVFDLLGRTISGHTLKHVTAAVSTFVVLRMLLLRATGRAAVKA